MKKLAYTFVLIGMFIFQACEGPIGPEGPIGEPGLNIVGTTYEFEKISFNAGNKYAKVINFPAVLEISDVVLIYRLAAVQGDKDVWAQIPQNIYFNEGILNYGFDFTSNDFGLFLDGTIDFNLLGPEWTNDQIFRIVVVPSDFPSARMDYSDYEAVTKMMGIEDEDFIKISGQD